MTLEHCYLGLWDVFFVTFLFSSRSLGSLRSIWRSFTEPFWAASWTSPWPWALCTRRKGSPSKLLKKEEEKLSWSSKDNRNNCVSPAPVSERWSLPWRLNWFIESETWKGLGSFSNSRNHITTARPGQKKTKGFFLAEWLFGIDNFQFGH